jgi:hypothetical protein
MKEAFIKNNVSLSHPKNIGLIQTVLVLADFVQIWMDKFKENNLILE